MYLIQYFLTGGMKMKKKWIFIPMVVVLTTILLVSGVVFAQENSDVEKIKQTFTGRVAVILGLEEKIVQDAFDQARKQIENEKIAEIEASIQKKLDDGSITKDEADKWREKITKGNFKRPMHGGFKRPMHDGFKRPMHGGFKRPMHGGFKKRIPGEKKEKWSMEDFKKEIDAALKSGKITQEQADEKLKSLEKK